MGILVLRAKPDALYIGSLAVTLEYTRLRVASYIIGFCDQLASHLGKGSLLLSVLKKNILALCLCQKMGFVENGDRRQSYMLRKNTSVQKS